MPSYNVRADVTTTHETTVEADSAEEAEAKGRAAIAEEQHVDVDDVDVCEAELDTDETTDPGQVFDPPDIKAMVGASLPAEYSAVGMTDPAWAARLAREATAAGASSDDVEGEAEFTVTFTRGVTVQVPAALVPANFTMPKRIGELPDALYDAITEAIPEALSQTNPRSLGDIESIADNGGALSIGD